MSLLRVSLREAMGILCPKNKTDTAAEVHLQRQSLYQRLAKILAALGGPTPESPRWSGIRVAVELEMAGRHSGRQYL